MHLLRKLAVIMVVLGGVSVAQADLVSVDGGVFGPDSVTRDTDTGLEWLDVTETMGMSFNEVTTQFVAGGLFEGWRYATISEVTSLWNAAGGNEAYYSTGWNPENDGLTVAVGAFTGFTRLDSDVVGSREIFGLMADSPEPGKHQASLLWDTDGLAGNVGLDYTNLLWAPILDSTSDSPLASWLVREAGITTMPPGLNPGDPYRLAFITKDKVFTATSPSIADYDGWVTSQANTAAELVALGTTWRVIGSTSSVDAKIHTETDDSPTGANGVPIYRLDGMIIANDYDDLWDGSIQNPLYVAQDGTVLDTCCGTWTGTSTDGVGIPGNELGAIDLSVVDGAPNGTATNWIQTSPYPAGELQFLYAISDVLTVFDPKVQVDIDVKPGSEPSCGGAVPVAVLGSDTLDVTQIDPATLSYEGLDIRQRGNGSLMCRVKDVNSDGYDDFLCQYQDTTADGMLTGELLDGTPIEGVDTICVVN